MATDRFRDRRRRNTQAGRKNKEAEIARIIGAINTRLASEFAKLHPLVAAELENYKAAVDTINAYHHLVRTALSDLVIFTQTLGAQVQRHSKMKKAMKAGGLAFATALEVDFAFPGLRFAIGHFGDLPGNNPLVDPMALLGAIALAVVSLFFGHVAGDHLARSERGVLSDPKKRNIREDIVPPLTVTDPHANVRLGSNPVEDILTGFQPDEKSPDALRLEASDNLETNQGADGDRLQERHGRIFHDGRSKTEHWVLATLAIVAGCSLWGVNGIMRSAYLHQVAASQTAPQVTSIAAVPAATVNRTPTTSKLSGALEPAIIIGSEIVFLLVVFVTVSTRSAVSLREGDLKANVKTFQRGRRKALKDGTKVITKYEDLRSKLAEKRVRASEETAIAEADGDAENTEASGNDEEQRPGEDIEEAGA